MLGQINLILCAVILLDIARREGRWRGLAVGVAAGIKLTPLFFIAFLLVTRQWAAARNLVLGFAGTVLIGFALLPRSSWNYSTRIAGDADRIGPPFRFSNQSINGLLHRSSAVPESWTGPLWLLLVGHGRRADPGAGQALLGARPGRDRGGHGRRRDDVGLPVLLDPPLGMGAPAGAVADQLGDQPVRLDLLAGGFLLVFMVRILWWPPHEEGDEFGWGLASTIFGNAWIITSLAFLALIAVRVRASSGTRGA